MKLHNFILFTALFLFFTGDALAQLTIYSGRSKALVDPIIAKFEEETGINVRIRFGGTTQLAVAIMEEGRRSPADVFWGQDGGALGALHNQGLLANLPEPILGGIPEGFKNNDRTWVATSGRARVLAYNERRVSQDNLPESIFDLTKPEWRGKVGWSPANASFQSFVTAMRKNLGEEQTRQWLTDMKNNGAVAYNNNNSIIQAIAAGEVELGITNHYYIERMRSENPTYTVNMTFFSDNDIGNLLNVAGVGVLNSSRNKENAERFIAFLLSDEIQRYFVNETFEYPVIYGMDDYDSKLIEALEVSPSMDLELLSDLDATLRLLRSVGLL